MLQRNLKILKILISIYREKWVFSDWITEVMILVGSIFQCFEHLN